MSDTIAAIATPQLPGAIGILRLSGPDTLAALDRVFRARNGRPAGAQQPRSMVYGDLLDRSGSVIDHVLCVRFAGPNSYTGEDCAEIHCHGSPVVLNAGLAALLAAGCRQARGGEFTQRAFLNGRMDLIQAESVADLIDAETAEAAKNAVCQLDGVLSRTIAGIYDGLMAMAARFYAVVDYPDEDIEDVQRQEMLDTLSRAQRELERLLEAGYREIVLTGIEISSWGRDLKDGTSLIDLVEAICAAAPGVRIRLGSLEPRTVTEDFCRRAAALPNLCPQFHLSMQSGCDATLKRMNRKYDTARYLESVELLNRWFDRPAVTTDLITGFPEETEEEFAQTLDFIRKCRFAQMHIFPYSIRPGTPAAKMEQVPKAVKEERARRAAAVAEEMHRSYLEGCVGRTYPVLFEQPKNGKFFGHAPNYMEVLVDGAELHNALKNVRIVDVDGEALLGEIVEQEAEA